MIKRVSLSLVLLWVSGWFSASAWAEDILMTRLPIQADIAVEYLHQAVNEHGYKVAHVQLCDGGMQDFGYKSDTYRVIFFGKVDEVRKISRTHPEFVAFLPLKMTVVAEKDEAVLSIVNPMVFSRHYPGDETMRVQFARWYNDIESMFEGLRQAAKQHRQRIDG